MDTSICLYCSTTFATRKDSKINKFCSKSCNAKFYHAQRKSTLEIKQSFCKHCNSSIDSKKMFCNHKCSATYNNKLRKGIGHSTKGLTKESICIECGLQYITSIHSSMNCKCEKCKAKSVNRQCKVCFSNFKITPKSRRTTCCMQCYDILKHQVAVRAGRASAQKNNKRSKNEILFAELCVEFGKVITNAPIFNGWDADVILQDHKVAILWNGIWHHKKITKKHSVKQVQNRDKIKIKEIISAGFTPYIINDMGSENRDFVLDQFNIFKLWMQGRELHHSHDLVMSQAT